MGYFLVGEHRLSTLETNTCHVCPDLDGRIYNVGGDESPRPPSPHLNCRCTTAAYIPGRKHLGRWQRDPVTGEGSVTQSNTFEEWEQSTNINKLKQKISALDIPEATKDDIIRIGKEEMICLMFQTELEIKIN